MIISGVYGFARDKPHKTKTFSLHQKVLRAIKKSVFGRVLWVNGTQFILTFSFFLNSNLGNWKDALAPLRPERKGKCNLAGVCSSGEHG